MNNFAARVQKATPIIEILRAMGPEAYLSLDLGTYDNEAVRVWFSPPEQSKLGAAYFLKTLGKIEKGTGGVLSAKTDAGVEVCLLSGAVCKVVRTETVTVPAVEEHTIEKPIYECVTPFAAEAASAEISF
jgi:hypothetical protein